MRLSCRKAGARACPADEPSVRGRNTRVLSSRSDHHAITAGGRLDARIALYGWKIRIAGRKGLPA
jgi:hypothetical protein